MLLDLILDKNMLMYMYEVLYGLVMLAKYLSDHGVTPWHKGLHSVSSNYGHGVMRSSIRLPAFAFVLLLAYNFVFVSNLLGLLCSTDLLNNIHNVVWCFDMPFEYEYLL